MNALDQVTLKTGRHTLSGYSIAGIATYLQVPDLDVVFDMGECPLTAVPLSHVFLTHAHGDHSRCLLRHHALRGMFGIPTPATYYLPNAILPAFIEVVKAEARFESMKEEEIALPLLHGLEGDRALVPLKGKRDLFVSAFPVTHRVPSLGYTIVERRRKLKAALHGVDGKTIAAMKARNEAVTDDQDVPLLTFIGDCVGASLFEQDHIWKSPVVIIEATFLSPGDEARAASTGHTHLQDVVRLLRERPIETEHIVLKHFSLKHTPDEVRAIVAAAIPDDFKARVQLLL